MKTKRIKLTVSFEISANVKPKKEDLLNFLEGVFEGRVTTASKDCCIDYDRSDCDLNMLSAITIKD